MKLLAIDIETSPLLVWAWSLRQKYIPISNIVRPTRMMSFAAGWIGKRAVDFYSEQVDPGASEDDRAQQHALMVLEAHALLDEADAIVHWNGDHFDRPHLNREFRDHGLNPPAPYKQIDLMKVERRQFYDPSSKLAYATRALELEQGKIDNSGMPLWFACMDNDPAAWREMKRYNIRDVKALKEIYPIYLPWIEGHPNVALELGADVCTRCGSADYQHRGSRDTAVSSYPRMQCNACGGWFKGKHRVAGANFSSIPLAS